MGVRVQTTIGLSVGFGASLDDCIFQRDLSELIDTLDHASSFAMTLAASAADIEVPMGDIAAGRLLYVEAEGEIEVNLSGVGTDPILITRPIAPASASAGDLKGYLLTTATYTSVHLTNPSVTESVRVRVCLVGDLVT